MKVPFFVVVQFGSLPNSSSLFQVPEETLNVTDHPPRPTCVRSRFLRTASGPRSGWSDSLGSRAPNGCLRLLSELIQEPLRPRPPGFAEQRGFEIPFEGAERALLAVQCKLTVHGRLGDGIEVRGQGI